MPRRQSRLRTSRSSSVEHLPFVGQHDLPENSDALRSRGYLARSPASNQCSPAADRPKLHAVASGRLPAGPRGGSRRPGGNECKHFPSDDRLLRTVQRSALGDAHGAGPGSAGHDGLPKPAPWHNANPAAITGYPRNRRHDCHSGHRFAGRHSRKRRPRSNRNRSRRHSGPRRACSECGRAQSSPPPSQSHCQDEQPARQTRCRRVSGLTERSRTAAYLADARSRGLGCNRCATQAFATGQRLRSKRNSWPRREDSSS